jgi:Tfp pilus assembly protein PilO
MPKWLKVVKKYLIWMSLSYILLYVVFHFFVFARFKEELGKNKSTKREIENKYLSMKRLSKQITEKHQGIFDTSFPKINAMHWLQSDDPNFVFYNHIAQTAEKQGVIFEMFKREKDDKEQNRYYTWQVGLQGKFFNILNFINEIESDPKYLKINDMTMNSGKKDGIVFFEIKLSGVKDFEGDMAK